MVNGHEKIIAIGMKYQVLVNHGTELCLSTLLRYYFLCFLCFSCFLYFSCFLSFPCFLLLFSMFSQCFTIHSAHLVWTGYYLEAVCDLHCTVAEQHDYTHYYTDIVQSAQ